MCASKPSMGDERGVVVPKRGWETAAHAVPARRGKWVCRGAMAKRMSMLRLARIML